MSSPVDEKPRPAFVDGDVNRQNSSSEGTVVGDGSYPQEGTSHRQGPDIRIDTAQEAHLEPLDDVKSPSRNREQASRLDDDLKLLQIEQQISQDNLDVRNSVDGRTRSVRRERSRREEVVDEFDVATNPLHERTQKYRPPDHPTTKVGIFFKKVHNSNVFVRWITYVTPVTLVILIPLLIGSLVAPATEAAVGGVKLQWFCIWLEIVWLTLWLGRLIAKCLPYPVGLIASLFTNNNKKWRDMAKQLELAATLFFWWLAIEISFLPTMISHHIQGVPVGHVQEWEKTMNKVLISFFVLATLNFIEKLIIQLIAISFHLRTYQDRIEMNKFQIDSLTKLYTYSKSQLAAEDSDFDEVNKEGGSGARTPGQVLEKAQKQTKVAFSKFGDVAGKIAGDFTGRNVVKSDHPSQVVLALLSTTGGSQVLARRLYRTFHTEETETVQPESLGNAFDNQDECDAAFSMFDKDMNGDISMEELEAVCVEIGRERKAITASLKDLDSVVSKLDNVFLFLIVVISILVLISLLSTAAAGVLTSAGSAVLALSWLFQATAQEFLQSVIFVFVKHPFDVGDRVTIYGLTGAALTGDDYFVKEIALLYTEFKKMEGHVVQAPNSYLNTLFILNQRRSGGLAEALPVVFKFGTTLEQIEGLREKLLEFVKVEKREYKPNILTELREVVEAHQITLNVVFFYKSSWQNELLRLQRRNKFICAMMVAMQELSIEGPRMRYPGQKESYPLYLQNVPFTSSGSANTGGQVDNTGGARRERSDSFVPFEDQPVERPSQDYGASRQRSQSSARRRGESIAAVGKRLDFSLGASDISASNPTGDVFEDRENPRNRIPFGISSSRPSAQRESQDSRVRNSSDVGRSTSRSQTFAPGMMHRSRTDGPRHSGSIHRNRFFGRRSHDYDMETGMAGIPESPPNGDIGSQPIDARTGTITSAVARSDSNQSGQSPFARSIFQSVGGSGIPQAQSSTHPVVPPSNNEAREG